MLVFLEKIVEVGFPYKNSAAPGGGAQVLSVVGSSCCSLQGSSGLHFKVDLECCFMALVQIPPLLAQILQPFSADKLSQTLPWAPTPLPNP